MVQIPEANPAPPLLVVLSGPSGVGKDAAISELKTLDRPWYFAITATTRPMRPGEQDGVDYIFLDAKTFDRMRERDEFLECAKVYGRWYGVPRNQVKVGLQSGKDVILKIDVQGAAAIRRIAPEALFIFILPGSMDDLRRRLSDRMTESSQELESRLHTAAEELAQVKDFDYRVLNEHDQLAQTVVEISAIITAEKCRIYPRMVQLL